MFRVCRIPNKAHQLVIVKRPIDVSYNTGVLCKLESDWQGISQHSKEGGWQFKHLSTSKHSFDHIKERKEGGLPLYVALAKTPGLVSSVYRYMLS